MMTKNSAREAASSLAMPDKYLAEWADLRPEFDENIERFRKGDAVLEIIDRQGKPLACSEINIRQKSHAFIFGCNALMLGQLGEENERYEQAFARLFNLATTTFCWCDIEPTPGELRFVEGSREIWRRPPPDRVVAFGKKYGIALKGQPLLADSWFPKWAPSDPKEVRKLYKAYFNQVARRYGHDFHIWDVVNESQMCSKRSPNFPLYTPELAYVGWAFKEARRCFPSEVLLEINEAPHVNGPGRDKYFRQVKDLLDQDAGVKSVGFQFHLFSVSALRSHIAGKTFPPSELLETYDMFAELGLPLFISEITIPATSKEGNAGEVIQAEVLANLYRLWFSVPNMAGIICWNLPDGAAWKNEGQTRAGLVDEHLCEKPAYQVLYQLINREWKTHITTKTDAQGKANFRGFHGKYSVTVKSGGRTRAFEFDLTRDSRTCERLAL